jgi:hypothetical protein
MKIALLGCSPIVLESALRFHSYEANFSWFIDEPHMDSFYVLPTLGWSDCTSELGFKNLSSQNFDTTFVKETFSWKLWEEKYFNPLVQILGAFQEIKPYKVISIAKRFLTPTEVIPDYSRFHDLFRVIYQINPEEFIDQQKEVNPETYQRLSDEFIQSLQASLEMYEDFDVIFDFRKAVEPTSMSVSGRALGEERINDEKVYRGLSIFQYSPKETVREVILIGSGEVSATILMKFDNWLVDPRNRLFIVSHEENPYSSFLEKATEEVKNPLLKLLKRMESEFHHEADLFQAQLREWQDLDDFIRAKKPRPAEPIPRLVFFSGHNVTAIDQLIDKKRLFLTLEKPDWRKGLRQPENNHLDLKTIGVDEVVVANDFKKKNISEYSLVNEIGYFILSSKGYVYKDAWRDNLDELQKIEDQVFKLFSPHSHN